MSTREQALAHVNRAWDWFYAMVALSATNVGLELGLFETIRSRGAISPGDLAQAHGLRAGPLDVWARTLVHHGQLVPAGEGRVALAPGFEMVVCEPRTLLNLAPSIRFHARFLAADFLELTRFLADGEPRPPARHGPELSENVSAQTAAMHAVFMEGMLPDLPDVESAFRSGARILDVGCGDGDLGMRLCLAFPDVTYLGFDLDEPAVTRGRTALATLGLADRASISLGDVVDGPPERATFDVAFLFLALHEMPVPRRPAIVQAIHDALTPDGILVVVDETYPATLEEAQQPTARTGIHFAYTELLWGSVVPTRDELTDLLTSAGFEYEWRPVLQASVDVLVARPA